LPWRSLLTSKKRKNIYELSDEMKEMIGPPQFKKSVMYTYNQKTNTFHFYTYIGGREIVPIGVFSPVLTHDIPYDPQLLCETIAESMSHDDGMSYDIEGFHD
jgi:hypothetical protein